MAENKTPSQDATRRKRSFLPKTSRGMWAVLAAGVLLSGTMLLAPIIFDLGTGKVGEEAPAQLGEIETAAGPTTDPKERTNVHDLSAAGGDHCITCHVPQGAGEGIAPRWTLDQAGSYYTMYDSPTIDMHIANQPQGNSLVCLSCHDGTVATDHFQIQTGNSANDLSGTHPISVTYDTSRDREFMVASNGNVSGLPLFGEREDQVECATCHDPHASDGHALLRMDNRGSALCFACHIK